MPGSKVPPWRNSDGGRTPIPSVPPVLVMFQAWRDIPGYQQDSQIAHLQIMGVHRPEMVTRIEDEMLKRRWFFLYEVQTAHLLSLLRFPIGGDRLLVHGVVPALNSILKTNARVRVKKIDSIYVESWIEGQGTIDQEHLRRKARRAGTRN